jgi:hypothetical protein
MTTPQQISDSINQRWEVTWVTPFLVQVFIILPANTIRSFLKLLLERAISELMIRETKYTRDALKGNGLANSINNIKIVTDQLLTPVNDFLNSIPLSSMFKDNPTGEMFAGAFAKEVKNFTSYSLSTKLDIISRYSTEFSDLISDIISFIPLKIPVSTLNAIGGITGLGGFDFLYGVNSLEDLRERVEDLEFRLSRATALSTYAQAGSAVINNQLKKVNVYLDIIERLYLQGL